MPKKNYALPPSGGYNFQPKPPAAAPPLTTKQKAIKQQEEAIGIVQKRQADITQYIQSLGASQQQSMSALQAAGKQGQVDIRRQGAEALAGTVGAAPRTGLGARLAAARGIARETGEEAAAQRLQQAQA